METVIKTKDDVRAMSKNESCIKVMTSLFEAMAFCEVIRDIVEPKQQEVIDFYKFKVKDEFVEKRGIEYIQKPSQMYLADETDWILYQKEMTSFYKERALKHKPGCCPLLEAESLVRDVKKLVVDTLEPFTGISYDMISWSNKNYDKYFDIQMKLFAPMIKQNLNQK